MSKSQGNIYFGSLEDEITSSELYNESESIGIGIGIGSHTSTITRTNTRTDNINSSSNSANTSNNANNSNNANLAEFDRRALAKTLKIPTLDTAVRTLLIALNQPVTLFAEGPGERRERLKVMASRAIASLPRALELFPCLRGLCGGDERGGEENTEIGSDDDNEEFYVPGSSNLVKVRSFLLQDSIARQHPRKYDHVTEISERSALNAKLNGLDLRWSTVDPNGRPLSACTFTTDGNLFTGDWSGRLMKYEDTSSVDKKFNYNSVISTACTDRITATCSNNENVLLVGTCTGKILFNSCTLELPAPHAIKSLNWHPSNRFFASTSSDSIWRLWDAQSGTEVQGQEGHLGGVSAGAWHPDGALFCTGGTSDGVIRVWDCRLGRSIWSISDPQKAAVTGLAFSPQISHLLASSDSDGLLKFHDLRKLQANYMKTAAHRSCCSGLKFISGGRAVVTSGFDGAVRLWSPGDLRLIKEVQVSNSKVTAIDTLETEKEIKLAAVTFDRTVKIFSC